MFHQLRHALPDDIIIDVTDSSEEKAESQVFERVLRDLANMIDESKKEQLLNNNKSENTASPGQSTSDLIDVSDAKLKRIRTDYEQNRRA